MGFFNKTTYNADSGLASVGPGGHWTGAYTELARSNVTVVGGREGQVGIGGFLLGGGVCVFFFFPPFIHPFTAEKGRVNELTDLL